MENKKYEITTNELVIDGRKFFQVKALRDFDNAKAGDLGGYVENEHNLSQEGECWIRHDVVLMDDARVEDNAVVTGDSVVRNNGCVRGYAHVRNATVCDNAVVEGTAYVIGGFHDYNSIVIKDSAVVRGDLQGSFVICGDAVITGALSSNSDIWIDIDVDDENAVVSYPAPHGTEYSYSASIVASTTKDQWCFRGDDGMIEVTSREIDSLLPELIGPKFATYMQFIRDAHHSAYDIELFEEDFE
jgi:carbonic anhydrase/acetyltransferase-like protein (isoleucine patch superfamily)